VLDVSDFNNLSSVFIFTKTPNIISKMPAVAGSKKGKKNVDAKADDVEEVKDSQVCRVCQVMA